MDAIHQIVRVEFSYSVHFTRGVFGAGNPLLSNVIQAAGEHPRKALFVIDEFVAVSYPGLLDRIAEYCRIHASTIHNVTSPLVVPGGEMVKNTTQCVELIQNLVNDYGICRHSFVVAIGGGAVLDMAGFAAATSHRGVRLIRIPTTVLAQCDSGVGVKTSINHFGKKNFLGTFTPPFAVINDLDFLDSLLDRDWRSGIAEAVKVALIKDAAFFRYLEKASGALVSLSRSAMEYVIHRCAQLHLQHIGGDDPFETGSSRPLDFGHWSAHKLEQLSGYRLRHGEAVAIGIALDTTYSHLKGMLPESDWVRVITLLKGLGFSLYAPEMESSAHSPSGGLLEGLAEFREHLGGQLTIMLLEQIGRGVEVHQMDHSLLLRSIQVLRELSRNVRPDNSVIPSPDRDNLWTSNTPARLQ